MRKIWKYILCLMALVSQEVYGQFSTAEAEVIEEAEAYFDRSDYQMTWSLLMPLAHIHVNDSKINYLLGASGINLPRYKAEANAYLHKAATSNYSEAYLPYAALLLEQGNINACLKYLELASVDEQSSKRIAQLKAHCVNAQKALESENGVLVQSLDHKVNSDYSEHTPLISMDDSTLYFTSRRPIDTKAVMDFNDEYDENIYQVRKTENGWTNAEPLPGNINQLLNEATVALRPNGQEMIVFKTTRDLESSDLWTAIQKGNEWRLDKKLGTPINSKYVENSAALNTQGNVIYVSSDRPGGFGGFDLYRVIRFGNGDLSEPQNLGSGINSEYNEIAPFLLPDDKTLYYSSDNLKSMGGYDVFKTTSINDTTWSEPMGVGNPLNTTADDLHIAVSWKSGQAYFIRPKQNNLGDFDICTSNMPGFNIKANVYLGHIADYSAEDYPEVALFSEDFSETKGIYNVNERG
jgi:hypothetical protein